MRSQAWLLYNLLTIVFLLGLNWLADLLLRRQYSGYSGTRRLIFCLCAVSSVIVYALARSTLFREAGAESPLKYLMYLAVIWDISLAGFLLAWPLCAAVSLLVHRQEPDAGRRAFISRALGLAGAVSVAGAAKGVAEAELRLVVNRRSLAFPTLPQSLAGFRIVQISDSHLGMFFGLRKWEEVLKLVETEAPDLVLITGDMVDDLELLPEALEKLAALRVSLSCGVYACLGNHEYFRDVSAVWRAFAAAGIPLLSNENRRIVKGNGEFYLLAADYPQTRSREERSRLCQAFTEEAAHGVPKSSFSLLMAHHPDFIREGFQRGIPLTIAGHTHGAQLGWGERSMLEEAFSYTRGLYQEGASYGFVSSGVGHWLPFRFNCPPEIVVFTLMQDSAS